FREKPAAVELDERFLDDVGRQFGLAREAIHDAIQTLEMRVEQLHEPVVEGRCRFGQRISLLRLGRWGPWAHERNQEPVCFVTRLGARRLRSASPAPPPGGS